MLPEVTEGESFHEFMALLINVKAEIKNPAANPVLNISNNFIVHSILKKSILFNDTRSIGIKGPLLAKELQKSNSL